VIRPNRRAFALLALLAALAFAASPVAVLAHWLTQHAPPGPSHQLDDGSGKPTHAPICKLCVALAAGAAAAPSADLAFHLAYDLGSSSAFCDAANPTTPRLAFFRSRAPPQILL
jgi:hypothetical protein